jgi:uncharacterized protein YchJ
MIIFIENQISDLHKECSEIHANANCVLDGEIIMRKQYAIYELQKLIEFIKQLPD